MPPNETSKGCFLFPPPNTQLIIIVINYLFSSEVHIEWPLVLFCSPWKTDWSYNKKFIAVRIDADEEHKNWTASVIGDVFPELPRDTLRTIANK